MSGIPHHHPPEDFDIKIITCSKTYYRLHVLLDDIRDLASNVKCNSVNLVIANDIGFYADAPFSMSLWNEHLIEISPILVRNLRSINSFSMKEFGAIMTKCIDGQLFPARSLTPAEKSLLHKHFVALKGVVRPTLIIEDDISLNHERLDDLLAILHESYSNDYYYDLGTLGPPLADKSVSKPLLKRLRVGMTRTNCAYIINKNVAHTLAKAYWPCALPADLHHQYLLSKHQIPGAVTTRTILLQKSLLGLDVSSIQNDQASA